MLKRWLVLTALLLILPFVSAITINVPADNSTIQEAIDSAENGDTIVIGAGTYTEDLVVTKSLDIQTSELATIKGVANVDSTAFPLAVPNIEILAENVKIHGFTIESPDYVAGRYSSGMVINGTDIEIYDNTFITSSSPNWEDISQIIQTYSKLAMSGADISGLNIHDNIFTNKESGPQGVEAIYINPDTGLQAITITNNQFIGEMIRAVTSERSKTTISNNIIVTDIEGYQGVNIRSDNSQTDITITENTISGFGQGIRLGSTTGDVVMNYNEILNSATSVKNDNIGETAYARYNWWGNCSGPAENNITGLVDTSNYLGACVDEKTIGSNCTLESEGVTLYANITTQYQIGNVTFSVFNGTDWKNFTGQATSGLGTHKAEIPPSYLIPGTMTWTVFADDNYGHISQDGIESFNVTSKTKLEVSPSTPTGLSPWYISKPTFTLIPDLSATQTLYKWDAEGPFVYLIPFSIENTPNNGNETGGIFELTYWSEYCKTEPEQSKIFKVDLQDPQITDLFPIDGELIYGNPRPTIQALLDEVFQSNSGIKESSIQFELDGIPTTPEISDSGELDKIVKYNSVSDLSEGLHEAYISVSDNAGRISELSWTFELNHSGIIGMVVNLPEEANYNSKRIQFNISMEGTAETIEYINYNDNNPRWKRLCRNCEEYGESRVKTQSLKDGENNISIRATDKFENAIEQNISLFIDSQAPRVSTTEPRRNDVINGSLFSVKYTEDDIQEVKLLFNPEIELADCEPGKNKICETSADLTEFDGEYIEYYFEISDLLSTVQSRTTRVLVDTTSPELTVSLPEEQNYSRIVPFNISISEEVTLEYYDTSESRPRWKKICSNCNEYGESRARTKSFKTGEHNLLIRAVDKAGNSDIQEISFEVA